MLWIQRLREVTSEGSPLAGRCDTGGEIHSGAPGMVPLQPCLGAACASPCASLSTATMLRAAPAALGLCRGGYDRRPWKPRARACFKNRRMPATTATTALCCSITPCPSTRSLNPAPPQHHCRRQMAADVQPRVRRHNQAAKQSYERQRACCKKCMRAPRAPAHAVCTRTWAHTL